jgi:aminoglycoside 2''-phosphotransferase
MIPPHVREALRAAVPDADLGAAEPLGEGWGSTAYRVSDPSGDWVVRVPKPEARWAVGDLVRELRLLPALVHWGLPAPRDARAVRDDGGRLVAALHRLVEGRPLSARDLQEPAGADRLARQLGGLLTRLHAFPREQALALGVRELDLWNDQYAEMVEFCLPLLDARSSEWLEARVEHFHATGGMGGAARVLVHGDIAPQHLLLDAAANLAGVIDFGDAMIADPALDFAGLLNGLPREFMERVLNCYAREIDPQLRRRARFYIDVEPLFQVRYGDAVDGGRERERGLDRFAARAAAATRSARYTRGPD